jgi:hypothetical protein
LTWSSFSIYWWEHLLDMHEKSSDKDKLINVCQYEITEAQTLINASNVELKSLSSSLGPNKTYLVFVIVNLDPTQTKPILILSKA